MIFAYVATALALFEGNNPREARWYAWFEFWSHVGKDIVHAILLLHLLVELRQGRVP